MIEKTCFSINKKEMWIGGTKNRMPLRSRLIFVCSASSSNQFGWIPPYKTRWGGMMWIGGGLASPNPSLLRASLQLEIRCRFAFILFLCVRSPAQTSLAGSLQTKIRWSCLTILFSVVEEGGFEPPVRLHVRQFSKLLVSATHPSFQTLADLRKQSVCFPKRVQR